MNKAINPDAMPKPVGPYAGGVLAGNTLYISGQQGVDPKTGKAGKDVVEQAELGMKNVGIILDAAGLGYNDVVKTLVFLKNMDDFDAINKVYAKYFNDFLPARSCVEVAKLPGDGLFEIEAVAVKA